MKQKILIITEEELDKVLLGVDWCGSVFCDAIGNVKSALSELMQEVESETTI